MVAIFTCKKMVMEKEKNIAQYYQILSDLACDLYDTKVNAELYMEDPYHKSPKLTPSTHLMEATSVDAARKVIGRTGILIFASATRHGGGVASGAVAQEEAISRTTSWLDVSIPEVFYQYKAPYYTNNVVTAPGYIFYNDQYQSILEPEPIIFLASAAPNLNVAYDTKVLPDILKYKMRTILQCAHDQKLENIILGAYGCGVFKGDPQQYASIWMEVITEGWYGGRIFFAIPDSQMLDKYRNAISNDNFFAKNDIIDNDTFEHNI